VTVAKTLKIIRDEDPMSPRDWDHLSTMACWHRRYNLGDVQLRHEDPEEWLKENAPKGSVVLPLYLYDHSGTTMRTGPFGCPWDSGQVGWIVATPEKMRAWFDVKRVRAHHRAKAKAILVQDVQTYDHFLTGQVWGYTYEDESGNGDACWGFFGDTLEETALAYNVPEEARPLLAAAWEARS